VQRIPVLEVEVSDLETQITELTGHVEMLLNAAA
jgi:hypothetical protein